MIRKFKGSGRLSRIMQSKYLNNMVEQDHSFIKRITRPMLGFKALHSAAATLAGIETAHMIRKGQIAAKWKNGLPDIRHPRKIIVSLTGFSALPVKVCDRTY